MEDEYTHDPAGMPLNGELFPTRPLFSLFCKCCTEGHAAQNMPQILSLKTHAEIPRTKTHLWCRQTSTGPSPGLLCLLFVERTTKCLNHKPEGPLILTGRARAGNDVTATAADLQTLIRSLTLGRRTKGETDNPFVFSSFPSSRPIETTEPCRHSSADSAMSQRHAVGVWVWCSGGAHSMN